MKHSSNNTRLIEDVMLQESPAPAAKKIPVATVQDADEAVSVSVHSRLSLKPEHAARLTFYSELATPAMPAPRIRRQRSKTKPTVDEVDQLALDFLANSQQTKQEPGDELFDVSMDTIEDRPYVQPAYIVPNERLIRLRQIMAQLQSHVPTRRTGHQASDEDQPAEAAMQLPRVSMRANDLRRSELLARLSKRRMRLARPPRRLMVAIAVMVTALIIGLSYQFIINPLIQNRRQGAAQTEQWNQAWAQWNCTLQEYQQAKTSNNKETSCVNQ